MRIFVTDQGFGVRRKLILVAGVVLFVLLSTETLSARHFPQVQTQTEAFQLQYKYEM